MTNEKRPSIGALWEKTTAAGKKLLSGEIEIDGKKVRVVVWPNTFKQPGERSPDHRIYVDTFEPKKDQSQPATDEGDGGVPF